MTRAISLALIFAADSALAHEGLHHHPHGIEHGWIIAAAFGVIGGILLARMRGRK